VAEQWSTIMFQLCFFICAYWFVFYKMQHNARLLLPSTEMLNSAYDFFNIMLIVILALKTLSILLKIIN